MPDGEAFETLSVSINRPHITNLPVEHRADSFQYAICGDVQRRRFRKNACHGQIGGEQVLTFPHCMGDGSSLFHGGSQEEKHHRIRSEEHLQKNQ